MEISREDHRIFTEGQGQLPAEFTFPFVDRRVVDVNHVFSDVLLRGQGIRGALMKEAVVMIRKKYWRCMAFSSYAFAWMERHEKEQDIRTKGGPRRSWLVYIPMHCIFVIR